MWLPFGEVGGQDQWGLSWELKPGAGGGCGRILKPQTPQAPTFTFVFQAENSVGVASSTVSSSDFSYFWLGPRSVAILSVKQLPPIPRV